MALVLPPGWHGKLPSLGDFASRRLAPEFVEAWDRWLAEGLQALQQQLGPDWLQAYLAGPTWRFVLMPGALPGPLGAQAWAGVLMPSVDKVGRYFPFTLALPLGEPPAPPALEALWRWLGRLDDLAADALLDDWGVDRLEDELARLPGPAMAPPAELPAPPEPGGLAPLPPDAGPAACIALEAHALWRPHAQGLAYWHAQPEHHAPRLLRSRGLPAAQAMAALFGDPGAAPAA